MNQGEGPATSDHIMADVANHDVRPPIGATAHCDLRRSSLAGWLMRSVLHRLGDPAIQIVLWNGETICTTRQTPLASVSLADVTTLIRLFAHPDLAFGEAYTTGKIAVSGSLTQLVEAYYRGESTVEPRNPLGRLKSIFRLRGRRKSLAQSRDDIHHHYDIGNDFYALWLGVTMAYTCAYFTCDAATLDQAQVAKMHHVSRKLRLRPGDHVVEAGCGWGSLALHMARHYGVKVRAFNISREQVDFARLRAKQENLAGQVEFIEDDYRNIPSLSGKYDAFVSVGMLEHVNTAEYSEFGSIISRSLYRSGRGLIHSIGNNRPARLSPWIAKHIFPGAHAPCLAEVMRIFESGDMSVLDVENLRPHYARTLQCWRRHFEQSAEAIRQMYDEKFVRMWRLYLAGSEAAFNSNELQLFQVLFAPRTNMNVPWTRADLYDAPAGHGGL